MSEQRTLRDFGDVLYSYLAGAAREGAVYVEMFCSPERPAAAGSLRGRLSVWTALALTAIAGTTEPDRTP